MRRWILGCTLLALAGTIIASSDDRKAPASVLGFKMKDIDGKEVALDAYKGKVLLIVNVASHCGLTNGQYAGLVPLYEKYKKQGFEVLAFPANNFGKQEPGTDPEIKEFCSQKKVSFPLFAKISVAGDDIHPLYKFLTTQEKDPKLNGKISWNFEKFLVDAKGAVIARFAPKVDPQAKEITEVIEKALKEKPAPKPEKEAK
jgi:glutathione peroxidase